ncbi:DUF1269 domain-containing protein [Modestobacter italicus]|uniref:DUF1269 domain-containing protein n=1 Tax=Modestobacter italicus (strain DSM 44449 / CECT 9708 / BC 501) TaxID=2732864 RepID=UPI001FE4FD62|nr:DUF1269 domain-containing protein [Modestobacter italicus]
MASLAVWTFPDGDSARRAEHALGVLSARRTVSVDDGAVLAWAPGGRRPHVRELHSIALHDAVGGDFWSVLLAVVFLLPALQELDGEPATGLGAGLAGVGVTDAFTADVRRVTTRGTTALAVLAGEQACETADGALRVLRPSLTRAELTADQLRRMRRVFAG